MSARSESKSFSFEAPPPAACAACTDFLLKEASVVDHHTLPTYFYYKGLIDFENNCIYPESGGLYVPGFGIVWLQLLLTSSRRKA